MKLFFILLLCLFLSSCTTEKKYNYEIKNLTTVYAYNFDTDDIEKVYIDYEIKNYKDVFYLYTNYQNYLPVGYTSYAYTNVELLDSKETEDSIIYYVNEYIKLVDDLEVFKMLLENTNLLLYEKNTFIIHNNKIL